MANINFKSRSGSPVGNFSFQVSILALDGALQLQLPVDAVKGVGDGRTTVLRHRISGTSSNVMEPFPGLSTPEAVTLEGSFFYDAADLKLLQDWREQVKGRVATSIGGYLRDVLISPVVEDELNNPVTPEVNSTVGSFRLENCIATRLSTGDWDRNSPAIQNWSLELEFADMRIL